MQERYWRRVPGKPFVVTFHTPTKRPPRCSRVDLSRRGGECEQDVRADHLTFGDAREPGGFIWIDNGNGPLQICKAVVVRIASAGPAPSELKWSNSQIIQPMSVRIQLHQHRRRPTEAPLPGESEGVISTERRWRLSEANFSRRFSQKPASQSAMRQRVANFAGFWIGVSKFIRILTRKLIAKMSARLHAENKPHRADDPGAVRLHFGDDAWQGFTFRPFQRPFTSSRMTSVAP
jgi:hypothetical protein